MKDIVAVSIMESPGFRQILKDYGKTFEGCLDLILVMNGAKRYEEYADKAFGNRANKIYFTPESTHNFEPREQSIIGKPNPECEALIYDDRWETFASFHEAFAWMKQVGYNQKRISVFYSGGDCHAYRTQNQSEYKDKKVLCSVEDFLQIQKTHSGSEPPRLRF